MPNESKVHTVDEKQISRERERERERKRDSSSSSSGGGGEIQAMRYVVEPNGG